VAISRSLPACFEGLRKFALSHFMASYVWGSAEVENTSLVPIDRAVLGRFANGQSLMMDGVRRS
jgi:hypothetical protein